MKRVFFFAPSRLRVELFEAALSAPIRIVAGEIISYALVGYCGSK